jgi:hypothetical protein
MREPNSLVNPIHFEDFGGRQFERLVFAYGMNNFSPSSEILRGLVGFSVSWTRRLSNLAGAAKWFSENRGWSRQANRSAPGELRIGEHFLSEFIILWCPLS